MIYFVDFSGFRLCSVEGYTVIGSLLFLVYSLPCAGELYLLLYYTKPSIMFHLSKHIYVIYIHLFYHNHEEIS